jgi:tetratricopeptide (TPR) repeat protein
LLTIVNTMQMLRQVDLIPVLPRVYAFAQLLERHHGKLALAGDAFESVIRLADPEFDAEVVMDAYDRLSFCQRKLGALDSARETSATLVKIATRQKDHARVLRGKIGIGLVAMFRGNLSEADSQFVSVAVEAQRRDLNREYAAAMHNRAVVASRGGNAADAVVLAHQALKHTSEPVARDRVLGDLAAFLVKLEQYDAAIDALRILEITAVSDEPRQVSKAILLTAAARSGNRELFETTRQELASVTFAVETHVNLMVETAKGLRLFGELDEADRLLATASETAARVGLQASITEIEALQASPITPRLGKAAAWSGISATSEVVSDLRQRAASLIGAK